MLVVLVAVLAVLVVVLQGADLHEVGQQHRLRQAVLLVRLLELVQSLQHLPENQVDLQEQVDYFEIDNAYAL